MDRRYTTVMEAVNSFDTSVSQEMCVHRLTCVIPHTIITITVLNILWYRTCHYSFSKAVKIIKFHSRLRIADFR
jgi:hypothetical protein